MKCPLKFIAIAGNIGSGKSSLTEALGNYYNIDTCYESVDNNPYLADFYEDMMRWSFHLQIYFLSKRFENHQQINKGLSAVVQDRSIYEDYYIFAKNLYEQGKMSSRDYNNYCELFKVMSQFLDKPDLVIYLRASLPTLLERINKRGRDYEKAIPVEYLKQLSILYEEWIDEIKDTWPLLIIDVDDLDFIKNPEDLDYIVNKINDFALVSVK